MELKTAQQKTAALLRKSGYKVTKPRLLLVDILERSKDPLSAQDILEMLGNKMDQATVYRTLKSLREKGLIRQIDFMHNHAHYELERNVDHHHLVCLTCGKMEDVHYCEVEETYKAILRQARHFSEIRQHSLEFFGVCKACAKKGSGQIKHLPR